MAKDTAAPPLDSSRFPMPSSSIMVMIHYFSRCTLYIFVHYLSNIRISKTSNDILAVLCV